MGTWGRKCIAKTLLDSDHLGPLDNWLDETSKALTLNNVPTTSGSCFLSSTDQGSEFFFEICLFFFFFFFKFNFIFKLYIIVLVLPNIKMNLPQVYMCFPSWTLLPLPSPFHPSGSSQCSSPKHPVSCIEPDLTTRFIHDILHVSMPFSQIFPPSPS